MRKFYVLLIFFLCVKTSFASIPVIVPTLTASKIFIPLGKTGQKISLLELSRINIKYVELMIGKKMKLFDRLNFKIIQKKLRDHINSDGSIINRKQVNSFTKDKKVKRGGLGGFVLGCLLGPVGVLIAYLFKDEHKKNRVKWAWIGLIAFIPFYILLYLFLLAIGVAYF